MFPCNLRRRDARRGVTISDVVVVAASIGMLALLMGPVVLDARETSVSTVPCMSRLMRIGTAVAACYDDHNDYGPTSDDGVSGWTMFCWTDLLYDEGYLAGKPDWVCPADARPDAPTLMRAVNWGCCFVDEFGVNEPLRYGVRTSYALNFIASMNFKQDRFVDASRQIYAVDGWWDWFGNMGAYWLFSEDIFGHRISAMDPNWASNMIGWRHGPAHRANTLFMDGHVSGITPDPPETLQDYLTHTFDTTKAFTWLPGEVTRRIPQDGYSGSVTEYRNLTPFWVDPPASLANAETGLPIDCASELSCIWRTDYNAWIRLPSVPADRH